MYTSFVKHFFILTIFLLTSCASIDKVMMSMSDSISSHDPVTGKREINLESESKEITRARAQTNQILVEAKKAGLKLDAQLPEYERVKQVFNRLIKVTHRRYLPWDIHLIENDSFNAYTIGGGKVFVYTGLLRSKLGVESDDELAAVLAHEIAHVSARHSSEKKGKVGLAKLVDKKLRTNIYDASFTTNQEDEADKLSVIYSALAGYNPSAAASIWQRLHNAKGSYSLDLLHTHPLHEERAQNLRKYAKLAQQYYEPGVINAKHDLIINDNTLYSYNKNTTSTPKAGEGGGFLALFETAANAYTEALAAKSEQYKRQLKQHEQEQIASSQLIFRQIQISNASSGGKGLFGYAINTTGNQIIKAIVSIKYWSGKYMTHEDKAEWDSMAPYEKRQFGIPLKQLSYTGVTISTQYVQFGQ